MTGLGIILAIIFFAGWNTFEPSPYSSDRGANRVGAVFLLALLVGSITIGIVGAL
jgi:hypothetical protein